VIDVDRVDLRPEPIAEFAFHFVFLLLR